METKLEKLLREINPDHTMDVVSSRVDNAMNSFQIKQGIITDWKQFQSIMIHFYQHVQKKVLRLSNDAPNNPNMNWSHCIRLMKKEYGPNGEKAAFEIIRTGNQGGLYSVLKNIARQMIGDFSSNEIRARINHFWNPLSIDEKFTVMDEYIRKFCHLLPSELTEGSAARIKSNFPKVLEEHAHTIQRLREGFRK